MTEKQYIVHNRRHTHALKLGREGHFECIGPLKFEFRDNERGSFELMLADKHYSCLSTGKMVVMTEEVDREV